MWHTPRQLILLDERLKGFVPSDPVDAEAYTDMQEMIRHEVEIKRKKYLED